MPKRRLRDKEAEKAGKQQRLGKTFFRPVQPENMKGQ